MLKTLAHCEFSTKPDDVYRYWGMQDIIDEALQRLYWACREGRGFPGVIPDENSGHVPTDAILRGLGLSPPPVDGTRFGGSRANATSAMQFESLVPRSYRPPESQPQPRGLTRFSPTSSVPTPLSRSGSEQLPFAGNVVREGGTPIDIEEEDDDQMDGTTDDMTDDLGDQISEHVGVDFLHGLSQELWARMGPNIHFARMPNEHVDYVGGPTYSNMSNAPFGSGGQSEPRRQTSMQFAAHYQQTGLYGQSAKPTMPGLGSGEQKVWQGRQEDRRNEALPWPGTMASLDQQKRNRDRSRQFDEGAGGNL